jgi:hypothetical protein
VLKETGFILLDSGEIFSGSIISWRYNEEQREKQRLEEIEVGDFGFLLYPLHVNGMKSFLFRDIF